MDCACLTRAMESRVWFVAAVWLAVLSLSVSAMSLPQVKENELQNFQSDDQPELEDSKRATWLDTRDLESDFKELVYMAIVELENEGKIADGVVSKGSSNKVKRGRWQGFCFRKTRSGRFLPYICWKGSRK